MRGKRIALAVLSPFAALAGRLERTRHLWAHARLSWQIAGPVDLSVVILGAAEVRGTGRVFLHRNLFLYRELYLETQEAGEIHIGDNVVISRGVHIVAFSQIEIGENSMIGEYASIRDANHRTEDSDIRNSGHTSSPIRIGRNAWVGRGVTILGGVTIGDNAIVGANAVVTRDVATGEVVAGVPARPLRHSLNRAGG